MSEYPCCASHCCVIHGCKYGHRGCPVYTKQVLQEYLCEDCYETLNTFEERRLAYERVVDIALRVKELREELHYAHTVLKHPED